MKKVLMGNHAAAMGAALARVDVVAAYPITPQTQSVELLSELKASGRFQGQFARVESEHSAMAYLIGAATAGARCFTSTSSQGLAYMHEMLHWASGARLPIVMTNVNRALAAPWNLWTDQTDSLAQRDTGWMQIYCSSVQEVLDTVLMAFKVSERVRIPTMVVLDGFTLSHTYEPVDVPEPEAVDRFLPPYRPELRLEAAKPATFGALAAPREYFRLRRRLADDMERAKGAIEEVGREFEKAFGRGYGLVEAYRADDAEALLVASGAPASTARAAVDELRRRGRRAGALRIRSFRPFPAETLRLLARSEVPWAVVDRNFSVGGQGIFWSEIRSALYREPEAPLVFGFVAGLGGGDITVELLMETWEEAFARRAEKRAGLWVEDLR